MSLESKLRLRSNGIAIVSPSATNMLWSLAMCCLGAAYKGRTKASAAADAARTSADTARRNKTKRLRATADRDILGDRPPPDTSECF